MFKANLKAVVTLTAAVAFAGCASTIEIEERDSYAQPDWYANCAQAGTEGWFWTSTDYVYACGAGESRYQQAAEEQMYAIALNNFAKRINGVINSETNIAFDNDNRTTSTNVSYRVENTRVTEHLEQETSTYIYQGTHYTFVKLKMERETFDALLNSYR